MFLPYMQHFIRLYRLHRFFQPSIL